ncbi:hypothetical protein LCGC14_0629970 [marine sediment metagenome]|uniref:Uncharacterized protein n=1 Tax=marine sediment metagenome TaxID=412755 RepID=A0A0F9R282_9ZZZZ
MMESINQLPPAGLLHLSLWVMYLDPEQSISKNEPVEEDYTEFLCSLMDNISIPEA